MEVGRTLRDAPERRRAELAAARVALDDPVPRAHVVQQQVRERIDPLSVDRLHGAGGREAGVVAHGAADAREHPSADEVLRALSTVAVRPAMTAVVVLVAIQVVIPVAIPL